MQGLHLMVCFIREGKRPATLLDSMQKHIIDSALNSWMTIGLFVGCYFVPETELTIEVNNQSNKRKKMLELASFDLFTPFQLYQSALLQSKHFKSSVSKASSCLMAIFIFCRFDE
jgi:hypothetical protein